MKKLLCFLMALLCASVIDAQTVDPQYQDGKIWFKLKNSYRLEAKSVKADDHNLPFATLPFVKKIEKSYQLKNLSLPFSAAKNSPVLSRTYLLEFSDYADVRQILSDLRLSGAVEYAEQVPFDKHCLVPNDPGYSSQWGLTMINAANAWTYFSSGSNITVAIVDDAIERTHPDLAPNLWVNTGDNNSNGIDDDGNGYIDDKNGYDVGSNDNNPDPPTTAYDHGTHVAGIVGARSNNSTGVASIGFSVKLMCVKSTSSATSVTNGYDGIVYAAVNHARVINMSWGGTGSSVTAQNIVDYAYSQGCILVAAAGNSDVNTPFYPAAYNNVIAVAATTSTDQKASFSNYGTWVDVSAPGYNIYSTFVSAGYGNKSGTSMASPMVAGLCGLMLSLNPGLSQADVTNCLLSTADNIDGANPSYIGQLGSGRINAYAAMQCISATLSWPPVANFTANVTTVTAGGQVNFTDLSLYTPTSWSWSFPGGIPASSSLQTPPAITYNTPGTYNVTLTVSNVNGTDPEVKTAYITVNPAGSCDTLNYPVPVGWTGTNYYTGATVGANGWINGVNINGEKQKANYFDASATPFTYCTGTFIAWGRAYSANPAKIVPVHIYDGTSGSPGTLLATQNTTMGQIMSDYSGSYYTRIKFSSPVTLPASKKFFVSVDFSNLSWSGTPKDTINIVSNTNGQTVPSAIWEQQADNTWHHYNTAGSWALDASLYVHPFLTNAPTVATFTQSSTSLCQGNSVTYNAAGSTYEDLIQWDFPGGSPNFSNSVNPTIIYNTPGTYTTKLYVIGGGCDDLDSAVSTVTILANPGVSIAASSAVVCPGGSSTLTASGGSASYVWSPSTGLSGTSGAVVTSTPSATITYNCQGTGANGCVTNSTITIDVDQPPVVSVIPSDTMICVGQSILFDGSLSSNVSSFAWSFPGGTPSTSTSSSPSVTYSGAGTFPATLIASNTCGADSTFVLNVSAGCVGIDEVAANNENITSWFDNGNSFLNIFFSNTTNREELELTILDPRGRVVHSSKVASGSAKEQVNMEKYSVGMYIVHIKGKQTNYTKRFVKN
ncbi:MAG: S8 family serine peptidase [Bacteroidia bacterium]